MPTFGWVHEDAWEGFLAGTERVIGPHPSQPLFICPFCADQLKSVKQLQLHLSAQHSLARPIVLLSGKELDAETVIRKHSSEKEYLVTNATSANITIDGAEVLTFPVVGLARKLSVLSQATVSLTLVNETTRRGPSVRSTYKISFRIADDAILSGVERAFSDRILQEPLTVAAVTAFLADNRCRGAGGEYAEGIAEYVMGVLVKEQSADQGITSSFARFRELFNSALQRLSSYERAFPQLLCAIIRFAINDFSERNISTGFLELDAATDFLKGPTADRLFAAFLPASATAHAKPWKLLNVTRIIRASLPTLFRTLWTSDSKMRALSIYRSRPFLPGFVRGQNSLRPQIPLPSRPGLTMPRLKMQRPHKGFSLTLFQRSQKHMPLLRWTFFLKMAAAFIWEISKTGQKQQSV